MAGSGQTKIKAGSDGRARRVLVVDTDEDVLNQAKSLLETLGYEPLTLRRPQEVAVVATKSRPEVILQDVDFADPTLLQVLLNLQENPATAHTPVVLFRHGRRRGPPGSSPSAKGYVLHPFDEEDLLSLLDQVLPPQHRPTAETAPGMSAHPRGSRVRQRDEFRELFHETAQLLGRLRDYTEHVAQSPVVIDEEKMTLDEIRRMLQFLGRDLDMIRVRVLSLMG